MGDELQMAQVEAAESVVVERLRAKGLLPPEPPLLPDPYLLGLMVVCDDCGSLMGSSIVIPDGGRQIVIVVDKCGCDSPLTKVNT